MNKKKILIIIIAIIAIAEIGLGIGVIVSSKSSTVATEPLVDYGIAEEMDNAFNERMSAEKSDIDGMSKLDKLEEGLNPADNSDTDHDGLTDKEEVEKYHTDPKSMSTAGDLYPDGYKVKHNMDPLEKYNYEGEINFAGNECKEIGLTADKAEDIFARVSHGFKNVVNIKGFAVLDVYEIDGYSGKLSIDKESIEEKDPVIMVGYGSFAPEIVETAEKDGNLWLNYDFESDLSYKLYVTKNMDKRALNKPIELSYGLAGDANTEDEEEESDKGDGTVACVIPLAFLHVKPGMMYVATGNDNLDYENKKLIADASTKMIDEYITLTADDVSTVNPAIIGMYRNIVRFFFPKSAHENPYNETPGFVGAVQYFDLADIQNNTLTTEDPNADKDVEELFTADAGEEDETKLSLLDRIKGLFSKKDKDKEPEGAMRERFPFQNFGSYISTGGNCAGIAYYTTALHNKGSMPLSGSSNIKFKSNENDPESTPAGNLSWDISSDTEIEDLSKADTLFKYRDKDFVRENYSTVKYTDKNGNAGELHILSDNLSSENNEFVKMIGSYWSEANSVFSQYPDYYYIRNFLGYKNELIEYMYDYINNGKYLYFTGTTVDYNEAMEWIRSGRDKENYPKTGCHAITLIDAERIHSDYDDSDLYKFGVYDSNFPEDRGELWVEVRNDGQPFIFNYWPKEDTSIGKHCMISGSYPFRSYFFVMDEDFNFIGKNYFTEYNEWVNDDYWDTYFQS